MDFFLSWVLPVFVGGLIGYVTNDIAIKMLFKPLKEVRFLGLRVPFTPGILPKNRHRLADSIGNTVSRELITEDVIRKRAEDPVFRESVETLIGKFTQGILSRKLGTLELPVESSAEGTAVRFLTGLLGSFVNSGSFERTLRETARALIDSLGRKRLDEILDSTDAKRLIDLIAEFASSEEGGRRLAEGLGRLVDEFENSGKRLADILPQTFPEWASSLVDAVYPKVLEAVLGYLRSPEVRKDLEYRGGFIVKDILDRLSVLQKLIVAAARYDRTIIENMPGIVDNILKNLEEGGRKPETRASLVSEAGRALDGWMGKNFVQLREEVPDIREKLLSLAGSASRLAQSEDFKAKASGLAARAYEGISSKSLFELAKLSLGLEPDDMAGFISGKVMGYLSDPGSAAALAEAIAKFISDYINSNSESSIAEALGISQETKERLDGFLAGKSLELLKVKIPDMLKTMGIRELVVEKVDSLDVEDVEKIVLDFMKEEFKWIDLFGLILGALIGLVQAFVSYLT